MAVDRGGKKWRWIVAVDCGGGSWWWIVAVDCARQYELLAVLVVSGGGVRGPPSELQRLRWYSPEYELALGSANPYYQDTNIYMVILVVYIQMATPA